MYLVLSRWPRWYCCGWMGRSTLPLLPCVPVSAMCTSASVPADLTSDVVMNTVYHVLGSRQLIGYNCRQGATNQSMHRCLTAVLIASSFGEAKSADEPQTVCAYKNLHSEPLTAVHLGTPGYADKQALAEWLLQVRVHMLPDNGLRPVVRTVCPSHMVP